MQRVSITESRAGIARLGKTVWTFRTYPDGESVENTRTEVGDRLFPVAPQASPLKPAPGFSPEGGISLPVCVSHRSRATTQPFHILPMRQHLYQILRNEIPILFSKHMVGLLNYDLALVPPSGLLRVRGGAAVRWLTHTGSSCAALRAKTKQPEAGFRL